MRKFKEILTKLNWVTVITGIIILCICVSPFLVRFTEDTVTITVSDKEVKHYKDDDKYLIFTDKGTFEITDEIAYFRFNSSDLYGKIEKGKTYKCKVCGFRIPLFSSYKNIITAEEVN